MKRKTMNEDVEALDAVLLAACKNILCCSSKTCSEAIWGDLGIEPSDMGITSTSLGSKKAVSCINNAFKNFVISSLHSGMCKKSKWRVYRELKEDFECKKYLHGVSDMDSKL